MEKLNIENYLSAEDNEIMVNGNLVSFKTEETFDGGWSYTIMVTDKDGNVGVGFGFQKDENDSAYYSFLDGYILACKDVGVEPSYE